MSAMIEKITGIPRQFLRGTAELRHASVAQRMSWAAKRVTKRTEDIAYCLLGIFGVKMPMIYGESDQAFSRLQQEIMRKARDDSILAWGLNLTNSTPSNSTEVISRGVLAAAPSDFMNYRHIISREQHTTPINSLDVVSGSLRVRLPLITTSASETFGLLKCGPGDNTEQVVGTPLNIAMPGGSSDEYIRPQGRYSVLFPQATSEVSTELIFIWKDCRSKALSVINRRYWFSREESVETYLELIEVEPPARWQKDDVMIATATELDSNVIQRTLARFRRKEEGSRDFVVVLEFEVRWYSSYVLVVDALDECDDDNNIRIILQLLAETQPLQRVRLRVFLTSRPEIPIRYVFNQISDEEREDFVLHSISPSIVDNDIKSNRFRLSAIQVKCYRSEEE